MYLSATGDAMEYMQSLNADVDPLEGLTTIFKDADDSLGETHFSVPICNCSALTVPFAGLEFALRNCSQ